MARDITDISFKEEVLDSDIPVLVDFWADWCGPCKMLGPIIKELGDELKDKVKIVKMDIDKNPNIPSEYAIRSIPTMILFKNGEKIDTKMGALEKDVIKQWITSKI